MNKKGNLYWKKEDPTASKLLYKSFMGSSHWVMVSNLDKEVIICQFMSYYVLQRFGLVQ